MAVGAGIGERIQHLRKRKGLSASDLAKIVHVDKSTLGRIENGKIDKVSPETIIAAAQHFGVSTDFLLGLTDVPDAMNYPVKEFGLTEKAAKAILSEDIHVEVLNLLLENERFCQLTHTIHYALEPDQTAGIMSRNNVLAYGESIFLEIMNPSLKVKKEIKKASRQIGAEIVDPNTVGNEQMMEEFRKVIQQLRKEQKQRKPPSVPVTRDFLKVMDRELLARADGEKKNINPRIVAEVMTDKSLVANICTPDQRERFVDLMTEILSEYGGTEGGEETDTNYF